MARNVTIRKSQKITILQYHYKTHIGSVHVNVEKFYIFRRNIKGIYKSRSVLHPQQDRSAFATQNRSTRCKESALVQCKSVPAPVPNPV
jgi:hypothetical protein